MVWRAYLCLPRDLIWAQNTYKHIYIYRVYIYIYTHVSSKNMYKYMYMCTSICLYIYMYIYVYTSLQIHLLPVVQTMAHASRAQTKNIHGPDHGNPSPGPRAAVPVAGWKSREPLAVSLLEVRLITGRLSPLARGLDASIRKDCPLKPVAYNFELLSTIYGLYTLYFRVWWFILLGCLAFQGDVCSLCHGI